jgi:integrase
VREKRILTQLAVDRAKPTGQRYDLPDGPGGVPGLMLRIGEAGTKTFALRYRIGDRQPRLTLGSAGTMRLTAARTAARAILEQVERGIDPVAAARAAKEASELELERDSVEAAIEQYAVRYLRRNTKRQLDRPLKAITTRDVLDMIDGIVDRGSPVSANRALDLIKRFLHWAVGRRIIETNVAAELKHMHKEKPRERTLSEAEIKAVWLALEQQGWPFGALGKLLLLTCQRRGEIAGLRWADLDLEKGILRLGAGATKTGVEHLLPLSAAAVEILRDLPRIGDSPLVFPAKRTDSANPISGFSKGVRTAHRLSETADWNYHDLRRTGASNLARLGIAPHVVERILNHSGGSTMSVIARTYNTYSYQLEMRQALEVWAAEIDRIATGTEAQMVPLARTR